MGVFPAMDQIFSRNGVVLGVDITGKVHLLSGGNSEAFAKWALTLTDVKTVWND
jgi:hypothetical protein